MAAGALLAAVPATAAEVAFEASTDHRVRGLSWSDGKPGVAVSGQVSPIQSLDFDLEALTLRESARHGGADVALSLAPRYTLSRGGWTFAAGGRGHVFVGRSGLSYVELTGEVSRTIGPALLIAAVDYAPSQNAIGGHNLHVEAQASAGVPGTALTVYGGVGRTTGSDRDDPRAWRLRPGGRYTDHHLGIEHARNHLTVGLRYSGTSIDAAPAAVSPYYDRHHGARLAAYLRLVP
jgi:hypothetical protein